MPEVPTLGQFMLDRLPGMMTKHPELTLDQICEDLATEYLLIYGDPDAPKPAGIIRVM